MERLTKEKQVGTFASLKDESEAVPGAFANYDCLYAHMIAVTRLKQYEDTGLTPEEIMALIQPHNEPLTIEELRELDGEPVYLDFGDGGEWVLVRVREQRKVFFTCKNTNCTSVEFAFECSGKAYRRRPEEVPCNV